MLALVPLRDPAPRPFTQVCADNVIVRARGLTAIGSEFPVLAWVGRAIYDGRRLARRVALYRDDQLVASFDDAPYRVNDLAFHPTLPVLAIATGEYDGGYFFHGALLLWNWETGAVRSVFAESRKIEQVRWEPDGRLAVMATAETDQEDHDHTGARLDVDQPCSLADLERCTAPPFGFDPHAHLAIMRHRREELAPGPRGVIWDLAWTPEGRLAAACSDGRLELWSASGERTHVLEVEGSVVQLLPQPGRLVVHRAGRHTSSLLELRGDELVPWCELPDRYACAVDRRGRILARAASGTATRRDLVIAPDKRILLDRDLGYYDVFGNFLRIDGAELYLLAGRPSHKQLVRLDDDLAARSMFAWDTDGEHRMTGSATLLDGDLVCSYRVHHPQGGGAIRLERRARATGALAWRRELPAALAALITWPALGAVVAAPIDGSLVVVGADGATLLDEPLLLDGVRTLATALAVHDDTLAIGTIDGRIALRSSR